MVAIITLTEGGKSLADMISRHMQADIFFKPKPFKEKVKDLFETYDHLIFIMATGIVVRTIAPYLKHKSQDPAVVVLDEKGKHCISLLSGHLGGANLLSEKLAEITGGSPVITTASDVNGLLSVDMLALKYDLILRDFEGAKDVTAVLVDGGQIKVSGFEVDEVNYGSQGQAEVYLGHQDKSCQTPSVRLIPKNLVLAMGCRKGTHHEDLKAFIDETFNSHGYDLDAVTLLASAWVKSDEACFLAFTRENNIDFVTFDLENLKSVVDQFETSPFVESTIGVGAVAEPSGYLASNRGKCLIKKIKRDGMTLSLWENISCYTS